MENVRGHIKLGNKNYTYISGNQLVCEVGAALVDYELTKGYSGQLKDFIAKRDEALAKEAREKAQRKEALAEEARARDERRAARTPKKVREVAELGEEE